MFKEKKDILFLVLFTLTGLLYYPAGIVKYIVLSIISAIMFVYTKGNKKDYYVVLFHVAFYIVLGTILALIQKNFVFDSFKQILIYLSSGFIAINYFNLYGEEKTEKLQDLQLYGMCIGYTILYISINKFHTITWESHVYAFIFGFFALAYICQKKWPQAVLAIIYMLIDNKRITNLSLMVALMVVIVFMIIKNEKVRIIIYKVFKVFLFVVPIMWIYVCKFDVLQNVFGISDAFTTDRLSIWNTVKKFYTVSPLFVGKGIGFILDWMSREGIFGLKNIHNDFLATYIELGFIGYILWLITFLITLKYIEKKTNYELSFIALSFIVYFFVHFLTDNIYIYISFLLPFYIVLLSLIFGKDKTNFSKILNGKLLDRKRKN